MDNEQTVKEYRYRGKIYIIYYDKNNPNLVTVVFPDGRTFSVDGTVPFAQEFQNLIGIIDKEARIPPKKQLPPKKPIPPFHVDNDDEIEDEPFSKGN